MFQAAGNLAGEGGGVGDVIADRLDGVLFKAYAHAVSLLHKPLDGGASDLGRDAMGAVEFAEGDVVAALP